MRGGLGWTLALLGLALVGAVLWTLAGAPEAPVGPASLEPDGEPAAAAPADLGTPVSEAEAAPTATRSAERRAVEGTPAMPAGDPSRITGRLLDGEEPVDAFFVAVLDLEAQRAVGNARIEDSADGRFEIAVPGPGTWGVSGFARDRGAPLQEVVVPQSGPELVLRLDPLASLHVRVVDPLGVPVAAARVHAKMRSFDETLVTDGAGRVLREEMTPGMYSLLAEAPGWARSERIEAPVSALVPEQVTVLHLRAPGRVYGRVLDAQGLPEVGIEVKCHARRPGGDELMRTSIETDADGRFEFTNLPPDRYMFGVEEDLRDDGDEGETKGAMRVELVDLAEGQEIELELSARREREILVSGRVFARGLPVTDGSLVTLADGRRVLDDANEVDLDGDGRFAFKASSSGRFVLLLVVEGHSHPFYVDVPPEGLADLVLELPLGRVYGTVAGHDGDALGGVRVFLERQDAQGVVEVGRGALETESASEGEFTFEFVAPGRYALRAETESMSRSPTVGGLVLTAGGVLGPVELTLEPAIAVTVRVIDGEGRPVAGASVFARQVGGSFYQAFGGATTQGRVTELWLPAGRYTFLARTSSDAAPESRPVEVTAEGSRPVELVLAAGTRLSVALLEADGTPLAGRLAVADELGRALGGLVGEHDVDQLLLTGFSTLAPEVGPLPPGIYSVVMTAPDGRRAERELTLEGETRRELELRLP